EIARLPTKVDSPGAINVHAAERDDAAGDAAKCVHELSSLTFGAEDEVDDYVELLALQGGTVICELVAMTDDLRCSFGSGSVAAMEDGYAVALVLKLLDDEWSDETGGADGEDFHC